MKNIRKYINLLLAATVLTVGFTSCEKSDYPDRYRATEGLPTIYGVRYVDTGIHTEQAFMEETLCILGENLRSVHDICFNDQPAVLNTSYITDNTLIVTVPKTMAVEETDKIYFSNKAGETVTYPFRVLPPAPSVREMSFEYAEPGETVSIYGSYFYEKGENNIVVEFAGAEVPHSDISIVSLDEIKVKIPEGAQPGRVKVGTASGLAQSAFVYKDNRGLLFDFDGTNGLYTINFGWHPTPVVEEGVNGSKCLMLDGSAETITADGGDWHDGKFHFEYWAGNWQNPETYGDWDGRRLCDVVDFSNWKGMCLKFEVNIDSAAPWTGCPCQIIFSDVTLVSNGDAGVTDKYGNTLAGCNNTYFNNSTTSLPRYLWRPWAATGSYDTGGKWVTVTIPFSAFTSYWDGTAASGTLTADSFANLEFFFAGGSKEEGTPGCKPVIKIDNIRAVPAR